VTEHRKKSPLKYFQSKYALSVANGSRGRDDLIPCYLISFPAQPKCLDGMSDFFSAFEEIGCAFTAGHSHAQENKYTFIGEAIPRLGRVFLRAGALIAFVPHLPQL
jgi:hypothetical protein